MKHLINIFELRSAKKKPEILDTFGDLNAGNEIYVYDSTEYNLNWKLVKIESLSNENLIYNRQFVLMTLMC